MDSENSTTSQAKSPTKATGAKINSKDMVIYFLLTGKLYNE